MQPAEMLAPLSRITMGRAPLPDDFILEIVFSENLVEHDLDVVRSVPVAVIVKTAGWF